MSKTPEPRCRVLDGHRIPGCWSRVNNPDADCTCDRSRDKSLAERVDDLERGMFDVLEALKSKAPRARNKR